MKSLQDLLKILTLKKVKDNQFNGISKTVGSPNVFGGQVLAQSLNAAYRTINNARILHSLHAYFLEPGNLSLPIEYYVDDIRNGGSFSTRRVTACQGDITIFILAASFHKIEKGYEHQIDLKPVLKQPEDLLSWEDYIERYASLVPQKIKEFYTVERPISFKPVKLINPLENENHLPFNQVWFKLKGDIPKMELAIKQQILTYISDYNILSVALYPHASIANFGNTQMASLDHSMWFFRDFDLDDWLLFSIESPSASNARGFARGHIYSRDGKLIASVAQEGLMRPKKPKS
jgi:acyl-CoA thioesterase-2